jgi:site-specific DNA-methyltransferase (adenine-specific)
VAASIREYGFREPVVVDEQDVIIVGHTRYKAAVKLGLAAVPVHIAHGLTPAQARAYRIADNQTATLSWFNYCCHRKTSPNRPFEPAEKLDNVIDW